MSDLPPSRLAELLRSKTEFAGKAFSLLSKVHVHQRLQQPQLWEAWRKFKPDQQFDMFVSAFRGGVANAAILRLLQQAIAAGRFGAEDLDHIMAGRKKIVDVPPEFWPLEEENGE